MSRGTGTLAGTLRSGTRRSAGNVSRMGFCPAARSLRDPHASKRPCPARRPTRPPPAGYHRPAHPCPCAYVARGGQGRTTSRHVRHAHDLPSAPIARDVGRCRHLLAHLLQKGRVAEGATGTSELESDPAQLRGSHPAGPTTIRPHASGVRFAGGRGTQGRRLPMGVTQALSVPAVLGADPWPRRREQLSVKTTRLQDESTSAAIHAEAAASSGFESLPPSQIHAVTPSSFTAMSCQFHFERALRTR